MPKELALIVGAHVVAAGELIDDDPQLAHAHAQAARRRAARLSIVREASAETAYAAGEYAVALSEYRALRRMTGSMIYTAVMADCERALGHPDAALRLIQEARQSPEVMDDPVQAIELTLVEAGARDDAGQRAEALRLLKTAISTSRAPQGSLARLRYAYSDLLAESGQLDAAREWFAAAASLDVEGELDADERIAKLDGVEWELDDESEDDESADDESDDDESEDGESDDEDSELAETD